MTDFADLQAQLREDMLGSRNWPSQDELSPHYVEPPAEPWTWQTVLKMALVVVPTSLVLWAAIIWALGWLISANAAERDRRHDLWLLTKPVAIEWAAANDEQHIFRIGVDYPAKAQCEEAKKAMRKVAGTLQCLPQGE